MLEWIFSTFAGQGYWHAKKNYPNEEVFVEIPVYCLNQEDKVSLKEKGSSVLKLSNYQGEKHEG